MGRILKDNLMTENEQKLLRRYAKAVHGMSLADLHDRQDRLWLEDAIKWAESLVEANDSISRLEKLVLKTDKLDIEKPILEETTSEPIP